MPNFVPHPAATRGHWAQEVAHNFCPPAPGTALTIFVSTARRRRPIHLGDLVLAFAHNRVVMVSRVVDCTMPQELQVTIEALPDPREYGCVVGTVTVEVLDVDIQDFYDAPECPDLTPVVSAAFPFRETTRGDARPIDDPAVHQILGLLGLD